METILARHTGKDEETIRRDIERDKFLTAEEAKQYGIVDDVLTMIKRGTERAVEVVSSLPGRIQLFPPGPLKGLMVSIEPGRRYRRYASTGRPRGTCPLAAAGTAAAAAPCKGVTGWHASVTVGTC
jgi:hypothetical protein